MRLCRLRWLGVAAAMGLLCLPAALAQPDITINFESPTYTAGLDLAGQDGWVETITAGEAVVVNDDNGPSLAGTQCVKVTNVGGEIRLRKDFVADLVATYGPLIEFQYDVKNATNSSPLTTWRSRLYDGQQNFAGIGNMNYDGGAGPASQAWASQDPDGDPAAWAPGGPAWLDQGWHTVKWVLLYQPTIPSGLFFKVVFDGVDYNQPGWYFADWTPGAAGGVADSIEWLEIRLFADNLDDVWLVDNYQISGSPEPTIGACCDVYGGCTQTYEMLCEGTWNAEWTTCDPNPCPQPQLGACCNLETGECSQTYVYECPGEWHGEWTSCDPNPCPQPPVGACCMDDGSCVLDISEYACINYQAGVWQGADTDCAQVTCPRRGACCLPGRCCLSPMYEPDCTAMNGTFMGPSSDCATTICTGDVAIGFEAPRYALGAVAGQECWVQSNGPSASAAVITGDSGPSGQGGDSQCLEVTNVNGDTRVDRRFSDVVNSDGPVVTYQYDLKGLPNGAWFFDSSPQGPWMPSWWSPDWCQFYGYTNHDKSGSPHWLNGTNIPALNDGQWHTLSFKLVYRDPDGENSGEVISITADGVEYLVLNHYMENDSPLSFFDVQMGTGWDGTPDDTVRVDNYLVRGEPFPSEPTAEAGPDGAVSFGDVITLDASASVTTNGATIDRYRWLAVSPGQEEPAAMVLYDGPDAVVDIGACFTGSYTFLLQVFDSNEMRDTDVAAWTIGPAPFVNPIVVDFEQASGYSAGPLIGQQCWAGGGAGTSSVVNDNGPTFGGSQCADLTNKGYSGQFYRAEKAFGDLVAAGPLVMFQYDYKGQTDGWACLFFPQLTGMNPDGLPNPAGIGHWHTNWWQWMGSNSPDGGGGWANYGSPFEPWNQWHTFRWIMKYSPDEGGIGRLLAVQVDNNAPIVPSEYYYMRNTMVDVVDKCMLTITDGWDGNNDEVWVDNIVIRSKAWSDIAACCMPDGSCADMLEADCATASGLFQGIGNTCADSWLGTPVVCPPPQACCFYDGHCEDITASSCSARGGTPMGDGRSCADVICTGACCKPDASCEDLSPQACAAAGGMFTELESQCQYTLCPGPGWCCLPTGCVEMMAGLCTQQGGVAGNPDSTCADVTCAPNDTCVNAAETGVPSTTYGSTSFATNDPDAPACAGTSDPAPGVWYKVVGTGNTITAQTCNTNPSWDMQMGVYCDDCGALVCVGGGDDTCGQGGGPSLVSWCSRAGATYLIRCYGWQGATGDFQLDVADDGVSCTSTDPCSVAPQTGACCVHSSCIPDQTAADCATIGGAYQGNGTTCSPTNPCPVCPGDANCDGLVNFDDINPFVAALAGGASGWASYYASQHGGNPPPCPYLNNDANGNLVVNFDDINPFVALLVSNPGCP